MYGWGIDENKNLKLDDFNFATSIEKVLEVVGDATIYIYDECTITSLYEGAKSCTGLKAGTNISLNGEGKLSIITKNNNSKFTALESSGDITINGGTYNLLGGGIFRFNIW